MRKTMLLFSVALALGLLVTVPQFAADAPTGVNAVQAAVEAPQVSEAPPEPTLPEFLQPGEGERVNLIIPCTPEQELCCPPQCGCVVVSNLVRCTGSDPVCQGHTD